MSDELIGYVGPPDLHDGAVRSIDRVRDDTVVVVAGAEGQEYRLLFRGVRSVFAHRAEGMMLYAIAELRSDTPLRRFSFVNWDESSEAQLEIEARDLEVEKVSHA